MNIAFGFTTLAMGLALTMGMLTVYALLAASSSADERVSRMAVPVRYRNSPTRRN